MKREGLVGGGQGVMFTVFRPVFHLEPRIAQETMTWESGTRQIDQFFSFRSVLWLSGCSFTPFDVGLLPTRGVRS